MTAAPPIKETFCRYMSPDGNPCREQTAEQYCFWHDPKAVKGQGDIKILLEERAKTQIPMEGFALSNTDLSHIDLVNAGHQNGYILRHSDLYRADLRHAHLFGLDLRGSSLMKANLTGANLNQVNLEGVNLLGAKLNQTKLEGVRWGARILQENLARKTKRKADRQKYYQQAEELYRSLKKVNEAEGYFTKAGHFFHREMVMRRYQMPLFSFHRTISKIVDLFCGYGERSLRVISFSIFQIFSFALCYIHIGVQNNEEVIRWSNDASFFDNMRNFYECLYFSVVTFTTLGYGDYTPIGIGRGLAASEAFLGNFTLALFVVVFVKKMTR